MHVLGRQWVQRRRVTSAARALFDEGFYVAQHGGWPSGGGTLFEHFMREGWAMHLDPNRWFSTAGYLRENADVAAAGLNPFLHFIAAGGVEGRMPHSCIRADANHSLGGW